MQEEKMVHWMWKEFEKAKQQGINVENLFGKYRYVFSSNNGKISCVELINYLLDKKIFWEINCIQGNLFEGIERFRTFEEAKEQCRKYLDTGLVTA